MSTPTAAPTPAEQYALDRDFSTAHGRAVARTVLARTLFFALLNGLIAVWLVQHADVSVGAAIVGALFIAFGRGLIVHALTRHVPASKTLRFRPDLTAVNYAVVVALGALLALLFGAPAGVSAVVGLLVLSVAAYFLAFGPIVTLGLIAAKAQEVIKDSER